MRSDPRLLAFAFAALLAGCGGTRLPNNPGALPERINADEPDTRGTVTETGAFMARLQPMGGSAAAGTVVITQRGDVTVVNLQLNNLRPGPYAWALHERGNCSSRNGLSAGAPWTLPGSRRFPVDLLPEFNAGVEGSATVTARVPGGQSTGNSGVTGRAVLIYEGGNIQPIKAEVPNNVVACGVFEPARSVLF